MTENSVKVVPDSRARFQWARGIFYRKEAGKQTVNTRILKYVGGMFFLVSLVAILMQDSGVYHQSGVDPIVVDSTKIGQNHYRLSDFFDKKPEKAAVRIKKVTPRKVKSKPRVLPGLSKLTRADLLRIPPGTIGKAVLLNSASDGLVKAKLIKSVIAFGERFIDAGTTVIGRAVSGRDRLQIRFDKAILSGGSLYKIKALACEVEDQSIGLTGTFVARNMTRLAGAIGLNFLGGFSEGFQESEVQQGVAVKKANARNALLKGTEKASLEEAQTMMQDLKSNPPKIYVPKGTNICLMFEVTHE